ncbi:LysE family translocator [Rhodococcoides corynebacterioides]|uniref:LysE family translocator n=1 Tax=Rhodococcoides corynebacterioides TaxID=53972 RepID=UPI003F7E02C2
MIPIQNLLAFAVAAIALIVVPGPSVLFVVGRSIALGRRAGVLSVVGNALGTVPAVLAVAFGVGAIVASSLVAFTVLKVVGGLYLVWLGYNAVRHRARSTTISHPDASARRLLTEGFTVGLTNPKTLAFFVAVLPQFVAPDDGAPPWAQLLLLGLLFQAIALACDSMWAVTAGTARDWFSRSPRRTSAMSGAGGVMMIGLGGTLLAGAAKP